LQRSRLAKRAWLLFFLVAFLFYLYGLGRLPLIGPDEPRYAQVAREMLMRGDPITPTLGDKPWFEKPALLYWMMMASFGAFGVTEWAARLGPACSGLLTGLLIYFTGRRVEREDEKKERSGLGFWSGAALLSSAGMIIFSRGASFDIIVTMTLTAALSCFLLSELATTQRERRWWLAGFYAGIGASLLAKGLIGIVIPFGVVAVYFVARRRWPGRSLLSSLLWGLPLSMLIAAIWYGPITARHGWTFIDQFIIQHHFARYLSNKYNHPQPFYFYPPLMALFILPWTAVLVAALASARRWKWRGTDAVSKARIFALAWLVVPIAFFSLSGSKLPGYILPALPGAALLIGDRLQLYRRDGLSGVRTMRATGVLLLLLALANGFYQTRVAHVSAGIAIIVALPLAFAGLFVLVCARLRRWCALAVIGATFIATVLSLQLVVDKGARGESVRDLVAKASARGYASVPVYELYTVERTAEFYAAGRVARGRDGDVRMFEGAAEIAEAARLEGGTALVLVPINELYQLTDYKALDTEIIGDNGKLALVVVRVRSG
jgi:4-amino-4-deoxy-L-arabinose transferase-like glycosyltransferase